MEQGVLWLLCHFVDAGYRMHRAYLVCVTAGPAAQCIGSTILVVRLKEKKSTEKHLM